MKINEFVEVSFKKGATFIFKVDSNEIVYKCSPFSGKELVSVNGNLVSESQSYKLKSSHRFVVDGVKYEVNFESKDLINGDNECSLVKEGQLIKLYKLKYIKPPKKPIYYWIPPLVLGALAGVGITQGILPIWLCIVFSVLAFVIVFIFELISNMENWECEVVDV
ncbi:MULTISPECIES: hypothetical protein [Pseudoalteromonas]|uniref:Uncharacterized protein n=1 Tax=Pseudoalteromonas luteoviolacea (strain 2ta16) TaxID=1353533 RepID=V4HJF3_PSEL2|nr:MULTISPECIES: hypothetical protein [Pseudoalteromonas]ESP90935.1 hypothetical protein PL2TA16_01326 [Pseudoalteromonas luteoviolacea 2ta16]KZN38308.1 hypothetical protein N483_20345 [Pseudoalteromonas luteoviolacea NCIMB 1944]MCG7547737.1 hypothetical protein [Pseudoalteromonas sp. Of7M-16]